VFWRELNRIISRAPLFFVLFCMLPLFLLAYFVPGTSKEQGFDTDNTLDTAEQRFNSLPGTFAGYDEVQHLKDQLVVAWIAFGGQTDDVKGDVHGAYYNFYRAEAYGNGGIELFQAFNVAKPVFMNFYIVYRNTLAITPKVFITKSDYETFVNGVEGLYEHFSLTYDNEQHLNLARGKCNDIRKKVKFRQILERTQPMHLTKTQADNLAGTWGDLDDKRRTIAQSGGNPVYYADFCGMAYTYVVHQMNRYVAQNANHKTKSYMGFEHKNNDTRKAEIVRIEYLLDNGKANLDYSYPPGSFGIMHPPTGTTAIDFVVNAFEVIMLGLVILAIVLTIFCVGTDIRQKTVIGAIASPRWRIGIIWSKLFACWAAVFMAVALFCALFFVTSAITIGLGIHAPTVLYVFFGKSVVELSPFACFLIFMGGLFAKLFFIVALTALLCLVWKSKFAIGIVTVLAGVCIFLLDFFLRAYLVYTLIIWPVILVLLVVCAVSASRVFRKRDF